MTVHRGMCKKRSEDQPYWWIMTVSSPGTVPARQKCPQSGKAPRDTSWEAMLSCFMEQTRRVAWGGFSICFLLILSEARLCVCSLLPLAVSLSLQCRRAVHPAKLSHSPNPTLLSNILPRGRQWDPLVSLCLLSLLRAPPGPVTLF